MKRPQTILVGSHFQVFFSDESGNQVPEIQKINLLEYMVLKAEELGYNMDGMFIETQLGNFTAKKGEDGEWRIRKSF